MFYYLQFWFICSNSHLVNIYLPLGALSVCLRFLEFLLSSFDFLVFFWVSCLLLLVATCSNWLPSSHLFQIPNLVFSNFDSCLLTGVSLLLELSSIQVSCWAVRYLSCQMSLLAVAQSHKYIASARLSIKHSQQISQICLKPSRLEDFKCFSS